MSQQALQKTDRDRTVWREKSAEERIAVSNRLLVLHPRFREAVGTGQLNLVLQGAPFRLPRITVGAIDLGLA